MEPHKYRLKYQLNYQAGSWLAADLVKGDGATDALLIASIIFPEDGSLSVQFVSHDGRSAKPLDDKEWFKVWTLLTARLAESETLPAPIAAICDGVREVIRRQLELEASSASNSPEKVN